MESVFTIILVILGLFVWLAVALALLEWCFASTVKRIDEAAHLFKEWLKIRTSDS